MFQLTSYIANVNQVTSRHREIIADLTEHAFPCVISNDVLETPDTREYPLCSPLTARTNIYNKITAIRDANLAFFLLFMNDSLKNEIAAFELGLAISNPRPTIVLIGPKPLYPIHFAETTKIIRAYDYENFIEQRIFKS